MIGVHKQRGSRVPACTPTPQFSVPNSVPWRWGSSHFPSLDLPTPPKAPPLTARGLPAIILSSPGGPPPPAVRLSSRRRGCTGDWKSGDFSPVSAAHKLPATPRALHGEAPVFIALRCVYTHFGNGSKPAGHPKNAVESTESFPEAGAGSGRRYRGWAFGEVGEVQHPARGIGGRFGTAKGSGGDRRWGAGSHPRGSEPEHGAPEGESLS